MDQNNASPKKMNVGLIGAGFMAKAHSIAYAGMPMFFWPAPIIPVKKMIVDMNEAIAKEAKDKFAFESYSTDWHDVVNNPEIDVVDICTPYNVHAEIAIAAAKAGKHIICEKPLALTVDQAREMYLTAKENNIKINFIKIDSLEKAKNAPCIFNNWANFYKGEFVSNTILNATSFKKLID